MILDSNLPEDIQKSLNHIRSLKDDWDSSGTKIPTEESIESAKVAYLEFQKKSDAYDPVWIAASRDEGVLVMANYKESKIKNGTDALVECFNTGTKVIYIHDKHVLIEVDTIELLIKSLREHL